MLEAELRSLAHTLKYHKHLTILSRSWFKTAQQLKSMVKKLFTQELKTAPNNVTRSDKRRGCKNEEIGVGVALYEPERHPPARQTSYGRKNL